MPLQAQGGKGCDSRQANRTRGSGTADHLRELGYVEPKPTGEELIRLGLGGAPAGFPRSLTLLEQRAPWYAMPTRTAAPQLIAVRLLLRDSIRKWLHP